MRILILDDDPFRHKIYQKRYSQHEVKHAYTYGSFVRELNHGSPWDLIHLDHDLGDHVDGDVYVDGWGDKNFYTGRHAAQKICDLKRDLFPTHVIIQSLNPEGAKSMKLLLTAKGIFTELIPFSCDEELGLDGLTLKKPNDEKSRKK